MTIDVNRPLLQAVLAIAGQAGEAILKAYQSTQPVDVITKADNTPVTAADHAAHAIICAGLQGLTPQISVLSEESGQIPFAERRQWSRYWLVDPLDGTKEFIGRTGEFSVNIALIDGHQPVLGVVWVPTTSVAYAAVQGGGAFRVETGQWQPIQVRPVAGRHLTIAASRRHGSERMKTLLQQLEQAGFSTQMVIAGSALKFGLIAEGKADCYLRLGLTSEWDTAAAQIVLCEAGGTVVDTGFQPLVYNRKDSLLNPEFFALGDRNFDWRDCLMVK